MIKVNLTHPIMLTLAVALPNFEKRAEESGARGAIILSSSTLDE